MARRSRMRRCTVTLAAVGILLTACTSTAPEVAPASNAPVTDLPKAPATATDPAVTAALTDISETRAALEARVLRYPNQAELIAPLVEVLRNHEALLRALDPQAEITVVPAAPPVFKSTRQLRVELAGRESGLADRLATNAGVAASGPVARAIASMAASAAQRAFILTPVPQRADRTAIGSPPPSPPQANPSEVAAIQTVLSIEHADLWAYGTLGGRVSASRNPPLFAAIKQAYECHRSYRDGLTAAVTDAGATPVASEATYSLRWPATTPKDVAAAGRTMEAAAAAAYSWLVSNTSGTVRAWAINALRTAAVRGLVLQGTPENFPGANELTDR